MFGYDVKECASQIGRHAYRPRVKGVLKEKFYTLKLVIFAKIYTTLFQYTLKVLYFQKLNLRVTSSVPAKFELSSLVKKTHQSK